MKIYLLAILVFIFSLSIAGQGSKTTKDMQNEVKTFKNNRLYKVSYDKFKDLTTVYFQTSSITGFWNDSDITVGVQFSFEGQTLKESPNTYYLVIDHEGKDWAFLEDTNLIFLADDTRLNLGAGDSKHNVERYGGGVREFLWYDLTRGRLRALAESKSVEMQVATFTKKLKPENAQMFADVLKISDVSQK